MLLIRIATVASIVALGLTGAPSYAPYLVTCPSTPLLTRTGSPITFDQVLPARESAYITKRRKEVLPSLWDEYIPDKESGITGYNLSTFSAGSNYPKFAFAVSGGGYRAALYGAETLSAFDSRNATNAGGLLQLADYISGLSGGSWAVSSLAMNNLPDLFSLVLGGGERKLPGWDLHLDMLTPNGVLGVLVNDGFYDNILGDVRVKAAAGFPVSMIDLWGRAISYHMYNQTNSSNFNEAGPHDAGTLLSSVQLTPNFQAAAMPLPLIVSTSRVSAQQKNQTVAGQTNIIPLSNTQFEFTPFTFGSFDPTLSAHIPIEHAGTFLNNGVPSNSSACVNAYENIGFVAGSSAALLNAAEEFVTDLAFVALVSTFADSMANVEILGESVPLIANWPNSFYGFQPTNASFSFESTNNTILQLTDGGKNGENLPLSPLFVRARELDLVFAVDATASTTENWPSGRSLLTTQERFTLYPESVYAFPPIPATQDEFVKEELTTRPTFFGCNISTSATSANSSSYSPILVYLPNSPPAAIDSSTYLTNTSTFLLSYTQSDAQTFLEAAHNHALTGYTKGGSGDWIAKDWPLCLKCALLERARERAGVARTEICQTCLSKYCWDTSIAPSLVNTTIASPVLSPDLQSTGSADERNATYLPYLIVFLALLVLGLTVDLGYHLYRHYHYRKISNGNPA